MSLKLMGGKRRAGLYDKPICEKSISSRYIDEISAITIGNWKPTTDSLLDIIEIAKSKEQLHETLLVLNLCEDPKFRLERLCDKLESLPINANDEICSHGWLYFVLTDGEWYPCHKGVERSNTAYLTCLEYGILYKDGSMESGVALRPGTWAHCTADNRPSIEIDQNAVINNVVC